MASATWMTTFFVGYEWTAVLQLYVIYRCVFMEKKFMELLAPAGSKEAFIAAVESGADAVYLAGSSFGA